jgi:hypothetical protein
VGIADVGDRGDADDLATQVDFVDLGSREAVGVEGGVHEVKVVGALERWNREVGDFNGSVDEGEELTKRDEPVAFEVLERM